MAEGEINTDPLEERIGYRFQDKGLLLKSLTHPSFSKNNPEYPHNQRLEFLGDSVLGFVLAEELFTLLPDQREGVLTRYRSILVRGRQLSILADEINLRDTLRIADPENASIDRGNTSILEDAFEALIAAVYLDGGLEAARKVVYKVYGDLDKRLQLELEDMNPKGRLQELLQPRIGADEIEYRISGESGPAHEKEFTIEVWFDGACHGRGSGASKRLAEEAAAREALESLQ